MSADRHRWVGRVVGAIQRASRGRGLASVKTMSDGWGGRRRMVCSTCSYSHTCGLERLFPHGGEAHSRAGEASAVRVAGRRVTCVDVAAAVLGRPSTVWKPGQTRRLPKPSQAYWHWHWRKGQQPRARHNENGQARLFCSQSPVRRNRVSISPRHTLGV
ncbi:hypothetical protein COCSADRAFT_255374 [Bipolaris sorokiniana ND90Pr]|uniref:Uncharacterized protein n=1 Tax=Cochliobolus sativus (strain ND90Pr / ATCC 201652) TaxID=665912 RepID=M2SPV4_COCSN|nr:uncharacterized protein COCSADRAFT_255374 [Bipolaris sorokiniana ND90Pr]EMD59146.1 hypothetical protein COCSADRAFT_255374 [Bipolaris sorokiniana ND90Pr]